MTKTKKIIQYVENLNKFISKDKDIFINIPYFNFTNLIKGMDNGQHKIYPNIERIFLKSKIKNDPPYIEMEEMWKNDTQYKYTYKFVIPYVDYVFDCKDGCNSSPECKFEFRYENHPEKRGNNYPEFHLHILDCSSPHLHTARIQFMDFFNIIKNDFIRNNEINFKY